MVQKRRRSAVAVAGMLIVSACAGGAATDSTTTSVAPSDETPATTPRGANDESPWGPLAVVAGGNGADALIQGTIEITEDCVLLNEQGRQVLLVWPGDRTQWDAGSATIRFDDPDGGLATIVDGQAVRLGGGGTSVDEGGLGAEEWLESINWIAEPPLSCVGSARWSVSGVLN